MLKIVKAVAILFMLLVNILNVTNIYAAPDKVVAIVSEHVITQSELNARIAALQQQLAHRSGADAAGFSIDKSNIRKQALDDLIGRELQLQMAQRGNIQISEAVIDNAISNIAKRNRISLEQLKRELQKQGTSYASFRKQMREDMLINSVAHQVLGPKIRINEQEVDSFLRRVPVSNRVSNVQEYHCIDILIPTPEHAADKNIAEAKKIATTMLSKLRSGAEIADVIKGITFAGNAVQANDLNWRTVADLPVVFAPVVVKLKVRESAGPIVAPNGIHIIKLLEVRGEEGLSSTKITREEAREMVYHDKLMKLLKPWLQQLRTSTYVKIIGDDAVKK